MTASQGSAQEGGGRTSPPIHSRSVNYVLRSLLAGGIAGCAGKTAIAPLDRVKILFQTGNPKYIQHAGSMRGMTTVMQEIWRGGGFRGLFQGHAATLLRIFPYAAIKFMSYEQFKAKLMPRQELVTTRRQFFAGSLAGIVSVIFTYPMEMVRVRMACDTRQVPVSLVSTVKSIYQESRGPSASTSPNTPILPGVFNFYRGISATILGMIPYAGVSFATHHVIIEFIRRHYKDSATLNHPPSSSSLSSQSHEYRKPMRVWAELIAGGASGLIGQTCSYPFEIIRRRIQISGSTSSTRSHGHVDRGILATASSIWRASGPRGFFVGLSIGYVKVVPMAAVSFATYERAKLILGI